MRGCADGDHVVLKLDDGEDLLKCLRDAVDEYGIGSGFVVLGIGMLCESEIGYYTGNGYERRRLDEPHELVALHGSISTDGETVIHLHCALAGADHRIVGGHIFSAKVRVVNEILIRKTGVRLGRRLNPATGLKELTLG